MSNEFFNRFDKENSMQHGYYFCLLLIVAELKIKRKTDKSLIIKIPAKLFW